MALQFTKSLGNKHFESKCVDCGEILLWTVGDDMFARVDEKGDTWILCSKCYDGPRGTPEQLAEVMKKKREADGDGGS